MSKIKVIGLTGQTGAGKTSVSKLFADHKITVIDCDLISRQVVEEEKRCLLDLVIEFSVGILTIEGELNRKRLASLVFTDPVKLQKLNKIIFPYICERVNKTLEEIEEKGERVAVLDAPTLFESGLDSICDTIISVIAPKEVRLNRIILRDSLSDTEARQRMSAQPEDDFYIKKSQLVIVNDKDTHDLKMKTLELIGHLQRAIQQADLLEKKHAEANHEE